MKTTNSILNFVCKPCYSEKNHIPARIVDIAYNNTNEAQYVVIGTKSFGGNKERFFAIPILPAFLDLDDNGKILFKLKREDLILAKRVHFDDCPTIKENSFFPSIYEVYGALNHAPKKKAI